MNERDYKPKQVNRAVKKRKVKKFFPTKAIFAGIILVMIICGAVFTLRLDVFNVTTIEVQGNEIALEEEIIARSGISLNENIFSFNAGDGEKEIEKITHIKDAKIVRKLPSTVVIVVGERTPLYVLKTEDAFYDIDDDGVVLFENDTLSTYNTIFLEGITNEEINVGDNIFDIVDIKTLIFKESMAFFEENHWSGMVSQFYVSEGGTYYVYLKNGSVLKYTNLKSLTSNEDFLEYFFENEEQKIIIELIEGINPIYREIT